MNRKTANRIGLAALLLLLLACALWFLLAPAPPSNAPRVAADNARSALRPAHIAANLEVAPSSENAMSEPEPKETKPVPEAAAQTADVDLLKQLRDRYETGDRAGFFETEARCKAAQPWDFNVLIDFFQKVVYANLKRWDQNFQEYEGPVFGLYENVDRRLERALIDLMIARLEMESDARKGLPSFASERVVDYARGNPQVEMTGKKPDRSGSSPGNPDAATLGEFAARLVRAFGYAAMRAMVEALFARTAFDDSLRYGQVQIAICFVLGEGRVEAAVGALQQLFLKAEERDVRIEAARALGAIKGGDFSRELASEALREYLARPAGERGKHRYVFNDALVALIAGAPTLTHAIDVVEHAWGGLAAGGAKPQVELDRAMDGLSWWDARKLTEADQKTLLERFDRSTNLGLCNALAFTIGEAFKDTNHAFAKRVLLDKLRAFPANGWAESIYSAMAFNNIFAAYARIESNHDDTIDTLLSWYPQMREWGLKGLDSALIGTTGQLGQRMVQGGPALDRALAAAAQRIEGRGDLGGKVRAHDLDSAGESFKWIKWPGIEDWLAAREAETTTAEDEESRKFYAKALKDWRENARNRS